MNIEKLSGVRVLSIGDIMLDRYEHGTIERISPEAPVPVFKALREKIMLGGVGNVAANLAAIGCAVTLVSRIGNDKAGKTITKHAGSIGFKAHFLRQKNVPTTVKTRLIANNNHLLRIDTENVCALDHKSSVALSKFCTAALKYIDIVLLSDYNKGLLTEHLCETLIKECKKQGKKLIVDPKGTDYSKYAGAFLIKPNLKELSLATGKTFDPSSTRFLEELTNCARTFANEIGVKGMLVTLSEHGMLYAPASAKEESLHLPTKAKEVFDVSGAGDTALAALGAALGAGFDILEAMKIANAASSIVVSKLGTATANLQEIKSLLFESSQAPSNKKIVQIDDITAITKKLKADGKRIGFTNGCFDCCHLGHLHSLKEAKSLCDVLVVGVNSDAWIKRHKGANRPIQDQDTRINLLASLECVDFVVVFNDKTALPLVKKVRPHVIAKEGYAIDAWPEGQYVEGIGGRAVALKRIDGYSTTQIIDRLKE